MGQSDIASELTFQSARQLQQLFAQRRISCVELLEHYCNRVDTFNVPLNAIVCENRSLAFDQARAADAAFNQNTSLGPLHGIPMTLKESYDCVGFPTTWGLPELKDNYPAVDALAVQRLKRAGAIIFGKTNVPHRLADIQSYNEVYGTTNNPWNRSLVPGGSSGGSAATLAAGFAALECGSDIGGSIRNPAHYCGLFGHKPTWNLCPPRGHSTPGILAGPDLSVIGPLARSAHDLELALSVIAGPDEIQSRGLKLQLPHLEKDLSELRVAVWEDDLLAPVDETVVEKVRLVADTMSQLGATVDFDARPNWDQAGMHRTYQCLLNATMTCRIPLEKYQQLIAGVEDPNEFGSATDLHTQIAHVARFRDWVEYNEERTKIRWAWHDFFTDYDVVLAPIMATPAFPHDHRPFADRTIRVNGKEQPYFTQLFWAGLAVNAFLPSTVIPTGLHQAEQGLPVGVQIIGPEFGDFITIDIAKILEREGFRFVPPPEYC